MAPPGKRKGRPGQGRREPITRHQDNTLPRKRQTGGHLLHVSILLELLPEVVIARVMQLKGKRRGDFSRTIVVCCTAAVEAPRVAVGGAS